MPLDVSYSRQAEKYLNGLDATTKTRVRENVAAVADDYMDPTNSYPVEGSEKRSARVGKYRILLLIVKDKNALIVADINSRGQIYRDA